MNDTNKTDENKEKDKGYIDFSIVTYNHENKENKIYNFKCINTDFIADELIPSLKLFFNEYDGEIKIKENY
jgi:hypothetical protein